MASDPTPQPVEFDDVLEGRIANGIYPLADSSPVADMASAAAASGWRLLHLDCAAITTKDQCLAGWSEAADFPDWVGTNWDALADALGDLSWLHAEGYVVLIENAETFATASPRDAATSAEIAAEAATEWADNGTPFVVLTR